MVNMTHKSKSQIMKTYDSIAEHFDKTRYKPWPETVKFSETLEPGSLILDVGCGNGRNSRYLAEKGFEVVGIDISPAQVEIAKRRAAAELPGKPVRFLVGDATKLPLEDNGFDAAIFIATLHHLTSPEERVLAMRELHRCVRVGGRCLVSAWAREQEKFANALESAKSQMGESWEPGDMLLPWNRPDGAVFQRYYHLFSKDEFSDLLADTDFEVLDAYESRDNHYAVLRK